MMQFHDQRVMELISKKQDQRLLLQKGKRTKRQRQLIMSTSSSSCNTGDGENVGFCDLSLSCGGVADPVTAAAAASPANSDEVAQSIIVDDVEEDMANCLILLAQGSRKNKSQPLLLNSKAITTDEFECKTCNRRFPSFQALGGHRASHKKPKSEIKKVPPPPPTPPENHQLDKFNNMSLSLQITRHTSSNPNNNKLRIHECSICGAEFASGQALGGHMRRHRPLPVGSRTTTIATGNIDHESPQPQQVKKSRLEVLGLDLNLPAPEDDLLRESKFLFGSKSDDQ